MVLWSKVVCVAREMPANLSPTGRGRRAGVDETCAVLTRASLGTGAPRTPCVHDILANLSRTGTRPFGLSLLGLSAPFPDSGHPLPGRARMPDPRPRTAWPKIRPYSALSAIAVGADLSRNRSYSGDSGSAGQLPGSRSGAGIPPESGNGAERPVACEKVVYWPSGEPIAGRARPSRWRDS